MKEIVKIDEKGTRLDAYLVEKSKEIPRAKIQKEIKNGRVLVNKVAESRKNYKVKEGDIIEFEFLSVLDDELSDANIDIQIIPEKMELKILYEDDDILVINKDKGILVHPTDKIKTGTLVNGVKYYLKDNIADGSSPERPGIVHRIDKDTSGVIVIAKNNKSYKKLREDFDKHNIKREYTALCMGIFKDTSGTIESYIERDPKGTTRRKVSEDTGKFAVTHYHVIEQLNGFALVSLKLETGRTHQIRVHMKHINHCVLGDLLYGSKNQKFGKNGQFLHASVLGLHHPTSGEYMEFKTEIPSNFLSLMNSERLK